MPARGEIGADMDAGPPEIVRPKFRMWSDPEGFVHLVWAFGAVVDLDDAMAACDAMSTLTGGRPRPLLVDTHDCGPLTRPARTEFTRRGDLVTAVALVVGTPLSRLMGNFFLSVSRPVAPTRLFDDEAEALVWLRAALT